MCPSSERYACLVQLKLLNLAPGVKGLFGTAPAPTPPLLELELSQTVSAPPKMGAELGGALSQNEGPVWHSSSSTPPGAGAQPNSLSSTKTGNGALSQNELELWSWV